MHPNLPDRLFPTARAEAATANAPTSVPQTEHPAYALAFQDRRSCSRTSCVRCGCNSS